MSATFYLQNRIDRTIRCGLKEMSGRQREYTDLPGDKHPLRSRKEFVHENLLEILDQVQGCKIGTCKKSGVLENAVGGT